MTWWRSPLTAGLKGGQDASVYWGLRLGNASVRSRHAIPSASSFLSAVARKVENWWWWRSWASRDCVPQAEPRLWDGLLVVCAANKYDGIKLADQHIAEQLSKLGPVLYVDPPVSPVTSLRKREVAHSLEGPRLRLEAPGLARLTPWYSHSRLARNGRGDHCSYRSLPSWAVSRLGGQVRAVISAWPQYPVFGSCGEEVRVYWAQDDFVGGADLLGLNAKLIDMRERRVASTPDLIIAANPVVADTWRDRGCSPVIIPFGADVSAYSNVEQAPMPPDVDLPPPIVGVVGQINERTDLRLLGAIADRGRSLLLVGPVDPRFEPQQFDALRRLENVCWVGRKPFEALPGICG